MPSAPKIDCAVNTLIRPTRGSESFSTPRQAAAWLPLRLGEGRFFVTAAVSGRRGPEDAIVVSIRSHHLLCGRRQE